MSMVINCDGELCKETIAVIGAVEYQPPNYDGWKYVYPNWHFCSSLHLIQWASHQ